MYPFWVFPRSSFYHGRFDAPRPSSDREIEQAVVEHLRENPHTMHHDITVDVRHGIVVLVGLVSSALARRAAGDGARGTPGVTDVINELVVASSAVASRRPPGPRP